MSCYDCTRTELLRKAVAEAGRGLPAIEPGMPIPAGTGLSRRSFLLGSSGLALAVFGGSSLLSARAVEAGIEAASSSRILVSVFLSGGADTLSVLFPAGDSLYRQYRPGLGLDPTGATTFAEDPRLYWHPSAASLATLHTEGKVTVLPAVGYDHPDKSHFTSRHYWEVGATDPHLRTGWLGRYLDTVNTPDNPLQGLSLDTGLQPSLAAVSAPVAALDSPDKYAFSDSRIATFPLEAQMLKAAGALGSAHAVGTDPALKQAGNAAKQSLHLHTQLGTFSNFNTKVTYPTSADPFPHRLAGLAAMIQAGLPLHCVSITAPGHYDTHAAQPQALSDGLKLTSDALLAFQRDLEARGLADRVLVHVWSEFGRRAQENGSQGTDHGAAGIGFLIGSRVAGGMIGQYPGLKTGLDSQGNLVPTADFRGVYSALIAQWLGGDPTRVIPNASAFAQPALLR
ncbi:MAG TPA: DUF1501 domain-containing protein [Gaiellaceae bacterium]|nr:DUF1501 domain-containing protein [Gaiellaceae bacterium]